MLHLRLVSFVKTFFQPVTHNYLENRLLEYVILAEEGNYNTKKKNKKKKSRKYSDYSTGFRDLGCKNQLLRTLFFKTMVLQKMELSHKTIKTMQEIRNIQSGPF